MKVWERTMRRVNGDANFEKVFAPISMTPEVQHIVELWWVRKVAQTQRAGRCKCRMKS